MSDVHVLVKFDKEKEVDYSKKQLVTRIKDGYTIIIMTDGEELEESFSGTVLFTDNKCIEGHLNKRSFNWYKKDFKLFTGSLTITNKK